MLNNNCNVPNPCRNGGTCLSIPGGGIACICGPGFTGAVCDISQSIILHIYIYIYPN